jgi:hypothetical protein
MSDALLKDYESARVDQRDRNEARHIYTKVNEARNSPHDAGSRWPFELLQNALDAGPRPGKNCVDISLAWDGSKIVFAHDAAPFSVQEVAALLSGGSSKEFESAQTTGRFGTGFLVTHVLAVRTRIRGVLAGSQGFEQFDLMLDRGGDENAILENIHGCKDAIRAAELVRSLDGEPSARFEYVAEHADAFQLGTKAFHESLPYLFATCQDLGCVSLQGADGVITFWTPEIATPSAFGEWKISDRPIQVQRAGEAEPSKFRAIRFSRSENSDSALLVLIRRDGSKWRVCIPPDGFPRIFRRFPLRASQFLPTNFVLDGQFNVDQERRKVLMNEADKLLLRVALDAAIPAIQYSFDQEWEANHLLARINPAHASFDDDPDQMQWWNEQLAAIASKLAALSLVETRNGRLPAIGNHKPCATFISPRLSSASATDETSLERLWQLVDATENLYPPVLSLAREWTETASGWAALGIKPSQVTIDGLAKSVKGTVELFEQLAIRGDRKEWLARFLDVVGECWNKRNGINTDVLKGILPDQHGRLHASEELSRENKVTEILKDIAKTLGIDVRAQLLDGDLPGMSARLGLQYLSETLSKALPRIVFENDVINSCLKLFETKLVDGKPVVEATTPLLNGSVHLLIHIWDSQRAAGKELACQFPFAASDNTLVRWGREKLLMSPVRSWPEAAQPFYKAYPPHRVLAAVYCCSGTESRSNVIEALVSWGIAIKEPISKNSPVELKDRRLAALSERGQDTQGVIVSGIEFTQIALLQPEVLNYCQEGLTEASALLGLALKYIAPNDPSWRNVQIVQGKRAGEEIAVRVRGALWLADLKSKAWVPALNDEEKIIKVEATASTLKDLLDPAWLSNNDAAIALLSECFGFDSLELRLLGVAPDQAIRQELRDNLASLVELGGANPELYVAIAEELQERVRRTKVVESCRNLGLAVQSAIKEAIEAYNLELNLVDRGFDYEVILKSGGLLDDAAMCFQIGSYLLEVKATTCGEVRLTPTQASTASRESGRYVLCVVDLRTVSKDRLSGTWMASDVEPLAQITSNIGSSVRETCVLIEKAKINEVGIRNDESLRYGVPIEIWERGCSIREWVAQVKSTLSA